MNFPVTQSDTKQRTDQSDAKTSGQYLTFQLSQEMFAINILRIKEILEYGGLSKVPMMPPFIRGVINLRGAVVPVIDLKVRFGGTVNQATKRSCIVIIEITNEDRSHDIGIMVDSVSEVLEIPASEIEPPPSFGAHIRADFMAAMGKVDGEFVIILDVDSVLSTQELALVGDMPALNGSADTE
ncbi:chemotaxis protein CheW [Saccharospirillum mangrovi]|uniref:chemotaxis protein CheW n=1 Tax=Saccharospirillum mangrovi TaxID=2161747 RepID=UPI000D34CC85|nr:chemotaxis protein CheW [Saccharospirillum mangrovi]